MARYNGDAAGVYTRGSSVDYFRGNATLTAKFGPANADDDDVTVADALGTISGVINIIDAGDTPKSDVINLNSGAISATGTFSGNARMGSATVEDNVASYPYNGSWSGSFYNRAMNVESTADVDESLSTAPGSVAGTFGVTGTVGEGDAAVTTSYVGAFGAEHKP